MQSKWREWDPVGLEVLSQSLATNDFVKISYLRRKEDIMLEDIMFFLPLYVIPLYVILL